MDGSISGRRLTTIGLALLLAGAWIGFGEESTDGGGNDANVRFHGGPTYDFGVTNVKWEAGTPEYSFVTFDLSWSYSWRLKWTEPAKTSVTGKDMEVENWDAAWVFVKFLPNRDSKETVERNHWQPAVLDGDPASHVMPAGVTNSVKLVDDLAKGPGAGGARGLGMFIYRAAVGHGRNDWKGIKLRWLHGQVDPAKAAVRVYSIPMVYVPEGPFKVGSGANSGYTRFADGPTMPTTRCDYIPNIEGGSLTDGSWRGGPVVPFLVDAEWNGPAREGSRARRIGTAAGELWCTLTYPEVGIGLNYLGSAGVLHDDYPTGYEAFYCMKYDVTQGQYVDFLNSLPPDVAAGRAFLANEVGCDYPLGPGDVKIPVDLGPEYKPFFLNERAGLTITVSTLVDEARAKGERKSKKLEDAMDKDLDGGNSGDGADNVLAEEDRKEEEAQAKRKTKIPPVYSARLPFRSCSGISRPDMYAYAVWAGLRPMTELEFEKACRGVRQPVPFENNTGTTNGMAADSVKDLVDGGLPTERFAKGNSAGAYGSPLTVFRVGCFATATSDRVAAGATYWGILELSAQMVSLLRRDYLGTQGDGTTPAGTPGGSTERVLAPFDGPADWPKRLGSRGLGWRGWINAEYIGGRHVWDRCRLVVSAENRTRKGAAKVALAAPASPARPASDAPGRLADTIRITGLKSEPDTQDSSTISFDLAWNHSWRAMWTEPAEKNVTGKPLRLENWDAAWVFIKFLADADTRSNAWRHVTLDPDAAHHRVPAGASLDVGLNGDSSKGIGVFIYRSAIGSGANDFKNIKLRWMHGPDKVSNPATFKESQLRAYAIGMVYVPGGTFVSRVPWRKSLTTIRLGNATQPGGCRVATNTPLFAECPNGYNAFYTAKYAISQGQYAEYLNSLAPGQAMANYPNVYGINRYTIRCDTNTVVFTADVPDRGCNFLGWKQILGYEAWAGLRPITDLEYEKACRGPRALARSEDAWAAGMCSPFDSAQGRPSDGIGKDLLPPLPDIDAGASYWGVRGLSLSGCVQEWPGIIFENNWGKGYKGTHGDGRPELPTDWPEACSIGGRYGDANSGDAAVWVSPDDMDRAVALGEKLIFQHTGRYGARAVRTAPPVADANSPLQLDRAPGFAGIDVGIFNLSGSFRNDGDKPLRVELEAALPEACFPDGAASRLFTAAPKAVSPFKILIVLARDTVIRAAQGGRTVPIRVRLPGGNVLAEQAFDPRILDVPKESEWPSIDSLAGGVVGLRLTNAADRAVTLTVELQPPRSLMFATTSQRIEIAPQSVARASFSVPRQAFAMDGLCRIPYHVAGANGAPQGGETCVALKLNTRWWLKQHATSGPKLSAGGSPDEDEGLDVSDIACPAGDVFKQKAPPNGWATTNFGANLPFARLAPLKAAGSSVLAVTRVLAPADCEATLAVKHTLPVPLKAATHVVRLWINDNIVYDSQDNAKRPADEKLKEQPKPFRLGKGNNTMAVECRLEVATPAAPLDISYQILNATDGKPVEGLLFDMTAKE